MNDKQLTKIEINLPVKIKPVKIFSKIQSLFLDTDGTTPYPDAVVVSDSAKHPPAEDIGVMKVKVIGLKPDSRYFFQTKNHNKIFQL